MRPSTRSPVRDSQRWSGWIPFAGPLVVWLVHFITTYALVAIGCGQTSGRTDHSVVVLALTGGAAAVLFRMAMRGLRSADGPVPGPAAPAPESRGSDPGRSDDAPEDARFGALTTLLATGLGAAAITFTAVVLLFLDDCR